MQKKKIGIGISDFARLITKGCFFIDKSMFIKEVLDTGADILLIPRPRRFGKTLNLSMLKCFFELAGNDNEKERRAHLFDGLEIKKHREFKEHFARYPVIFITFKDIKETNFSDAVSRLRRLFAREIKRHLSYIPLEKYRSFDDFVLLEDIASEKALPEACKEVLFSLSSLLHTVFGVPPVILIDEYDTPIHASWQYGYYDDMISFMRGLLSAGLKDNSSIFKGVITGILRVAKESIFSDLNNLKVYTILERPFSDKFGITEEELAFVLREYGLYHRFDEVNSWYNGYDFGGHTIFNPWSVLNFVDENPPNPQPYWANTSSNALIKELIIDGGMEVRESVENLIAGKAIESVIDQNIVFPEIRKKQHYIFSLFFFSGYLKCIEKSYDTRKLVCKLGIPNEEVAYIFENIISGWLEESFGNRKLTTMLKALVSGNIDQFSRLLNEFIITTLSFFDTKGRNPEAVYQAFVLGLLLNLGQEYEISSNRELGYGRYDILILPRDDIEKPAVLMEMKSIAGFYKEDPEKAIKEAVNQINKRAYAKELEARGITNVIKLAVVSDGKKVWIREVK